jgi:hypothetical protein
MANHTEELRSTAAQCLALAQSTTDQQTRASLLIMWRAGGPGIIEAAQQEFNDRQMLAPRTMRPRPVMRQQQQIQPKKRD